jgi:hypothetical protein
VPELNLKIPEHWKGGYDLSNVIEMSVIKSFAYERTLEPGLTWQTYKWRLEDEYNSIEDWQILEEREISTK